MIRLFFATCVLVLFASISTDLAHAQSGRARVRQLNQEAMAAFHELDLERAEALLDEALALATREGVTGSELARIHLSIGVVAIAGYSDQGRGLAAFGRALAADPDIEPDPLTSTPEVQSTFQLARARAGSAPRGTPQPTRPSLRHVPPVEQLDRTALPLYVDVVNGATVERVVVMYKANGMRRYRQAALERVGEGFGVEIPCLEVIEGTFSYYVVAYDAQGRVVTGSGTDGEPHRVPIVTRLRGALPSLPGRAAPTQCSTDECPPSLCPGGRPASGGAAGGASTTTATAPAPRPANAGRPADAPTDAPDADASCILDSECAAGERCADGTCVAGSARPRFFLQLGGVFGAHRAAPGMLADDAPPMGGDPARYASYIPSGDPGCDVDAGSYCVRTSAGVLPVFGGRLMLGYWVGPRWAVVVGARGGLGGGNSTLSYLLVQFQAHVLLSSPDDTKFKATLLVGGGLGQVQVRPAQEGDGIARPYAQVGLGSFSLGSQVGYRFADHFGMFAQLEGLLFYKNFNVGADITLGVEIDF